MRPDPLRQPVEPNALVIVNEADVVVVDAGGVPRSAENAIRLIRGITDKPVSAVVRTGKGLLKSPSPRAAAGEVGGAEELDEALGDEALPFFRFFFLRPIPTFVCVFRSALFVKPPK